jgi:hypothetical protein
MRTIMVRYKTSEATADANAASVRAVYDQLRERKLEGIRYATYRLPDGCTFVHIATHDFTPGDNPLTNLPAFKDFQAKLKERAVEPPVTTELSPVDAYDGLSKEAAR